MITLKENPTINSEDGDSCESSEDNVTIGQYLPSFMKKSKQKTPHPPSPPRRLEK